jgi:multicomponent Na+:H+ antiporter subunit D
VVAVNPDTILLNWLLALPFFAAAAAALFPRLAMRVRSQREAEALRRGPWPLAALTCLMGMAVCARLIVVTSAGERVVADYWWTRDLYHLRLQADVFTSVAACLIYGMGLLLCWHLSFDYAHDKSGVGDSGPAHYRAPLLLVALGGGIGIALSADLMLLVFFLLFMLVPLWLLFRLSAPQHGDWFLGAGYLGGLLVLLAASLAWQQASETSLVQLPLLLLTSAPERSAAIAALLLVGLLPLLPAFPGHRWLVGLAAAGPATAAVGTLVALVGGTALLRLLPGLLLLPAIPGLSGLCVLVGLGTLWWGIVRAWLASDLRGRAAWLTVAGSGYLVIAVGEAAGPSESSVFSAAAASLLVAGPASLLAVWLSSSAVLARAGTDAMAGLSGLLRQMPSAGIGLLVGGLSLCGLPGTLGFRAQRVLLSGILGEGHWALAAAVILADIALALLIVDSFRRVFLRREPPPALRPGSPALAVPLLILTLGLVIAGIWAEPVGRWSQAAAQTALSLRP